MYILQYTRVPTAFVVGGIAREKLYTSPEYNTRITRKLFSKEIKNFGDVKSVDGNSV